MSEKSLQPCCQALKEKQPNTHGQSIKRRTCKKNCEQPLNPILFFEDLPVFLLQHGLRDHFRSQKKKPIREAPAMAAEMFVTCNLDGSINSLVLGDGDLQPLMTGILIHGYINPYYWVDDHPLLYGNNGSLDPSTSACELTMAIEHVCLLFLSANELRMVFKSHQWTGSPAIRLELWNLENCLAEKRNSQQFRAILGLRPWHPQQPCAWSGPPHGRSSPTRCHTSTQPSRR